jgi:hypothetical protein
MDGRTGALLGALFFILALSALTIDVAVQDGVTVLVVVSALILAMVAYGVIGALFNPPPED